MSTPDGNVPRVLNHVLWIPCEILPHFDPWHTSVAHQEGELVILQNLEHMLTSEERLSTHEEDMSYVWDHVHWIPSEILPHFNPWHTFVAHQEAELVILQNLEHV